MAYVKGSEFTFRGFSGVDYLDTLDAPLTRADACILGFNTPGCQTLIESATRKLNAEYRNAGLQVKQIAAKVPVVGEALVGVKDPQVALAQVKMYAAQFKGDDIERAAYGVLYNQARGGLEMLTSYAQVHPIFNTILDMSQKLQKDAPVLKKWFDRTQQNGIDTAGVVDVLNVSSRAMAGASQIVNAFADADSAVSKVASYLSLAVGCSAAVAAGAVAGNVFGAAAAAAGCVGMAIAQFFKGPQPAPNVINAVYNPDPLWAELAAKDAQRLAMLLRYVYGVRSVKQLVEGYTANVKRDAQTRSQNDGLCLLHDCYPRKNESSPLPGFNWEMIVQMARVVHGDTGNLDCDGSAGSGIAGSYLFMPHNNWAAGPASEFHDKGCPKPRALDMDAMVKASRRVLNGAFGPVNTPRKKASVTLLEWMHFFGAISKAFPKEVVEAQEDSASLTQLLSDRTIPVQYKNVKDEGGRAFSKQRWTTAGDWFQGYMSKTAPLATYEECVAAGTVRLAAAFSHMLLQYHQGDDTFADADGYKNYIWQMSVGRDMIASLPDLPGDPSSQLRVPVDPRLTNNGLPSLEALAAEIRRRGGRLLEIEEQAKKDGAAAGEAAARVDAAKIISVTGEFQKRLEEQQLQAKYMSQSMQTMLTTAKAPTAGELALRAGQITLTTAAQRAEAQAIAQAAANEALAKIADQEAAKNHGGSATPFLLAGAAALVAMKFLK